MVVPATVGSAAGTTRRAGMARGDGLVSRSKPSADDFELTFDPVEAPVASSRILVMSACMRLSSSGLMRDFEYYRIAGFFLLDVVQQFDAFVADEAVPGRGYQAFDFALSLATAGAVERFVRIHLASSPSWYAAITSCVDGKPAFVVPGAHLCPIFGSHLAGRRLPRCGDRGGR